MQRGSPAGGPRALLLPTRTKVVYGLGDHAVNLALASLLFVFPIFLTDVAAIRPALAGLIPLIGRSVDALTDPAMGRISDQTRWARGRRRPYFLIGMLPFGLSYAALWWTWPEAGESARFGWFAASYVVFSLAVTVISVPYLALIPEMAPDYDDRNSVNAWRAGFAILGALVAAALFRPLTGWLGGGPRGYALAGGLLAVWVVLPWIAVYRTSFERPGVRPTVEEGFWTGMRSIARHRAFRRLIALFLLSRIALDLTSTMFIYWFTYWIGRPGDFEITMGLFLVSVIVGFSIWVRLAAHLDKRTVFLLGTGSWVLSQLFLMVASPDWPRWLIFLFAAGAGIGYAAADMIPWSMLGEVVDADELASGERREGIHFGAFTFLRKLGGAAGVALALLTLDLAGFAPNQSQSGPAIAAIRWLTAGVPGLFVAAAALASLGYPLTRARHAQIATALAARRAAAGGAPP